MTNLIGQSIGHYHILEQLGEGGMAVVYSAYDVRLEREVAIKVILPSKQTSENLVKRFEREARLLARLSHPNVVKILDCGIVGLSALLGRCLVFRDKLFPPVIQTQTESTPLYTQAAVTSVEATLVVATTPANTQAIMIPVELSAPIEEFQTKTIFLGVN